MGDFPFTTLDLLSVELLLSFMSFRDDIVCLPFASCCVASRTMTETSPPAYQTTLQIALQSAGDISSFSRVYPSAAADSLPNPFTRPPTRLRLDLFDAATFLER